MSNPFGNMVDAGNAVASDTLGGGFTPLPSNVYGLTISAMYLGKSAKGSLNITIEGKTAEGKQFRETQYISNAKGENQYVDKKTNEKRYMPSYLLFNGICLMLTGKGLMQQDIQKRVAEVYDSSKGSRVPTDVDTFVEVTGKTLKAGILHRKEDKQKLNDQTGNYENTGDARESNVLAAVFRESDNLSPEEIVNGAKEPKFYTEWLTRWENQVDDRFKGLQGQGKAGAPTGGFAGGAGNTAAGASSNPFA